MGEKTELGAEIGDLLGGPDECPHCGKVLNSQHIAKEFEDGQKMTKCGNVVQNGDAPNGFGKQSNGMVTRCIECGEEYRSARVTEHYLDRKCPDCDDISDRS